MAVLSKVCKPDKFEQDNSPKLNFTNIWDVHSNFVECQSFFESNSSDILPLCETDLDDLIDSCNVSLRAYLPLIQKDSVIHIHGLAVYVKEGLAFAQDLYLENSVDSYVFNWLCFIQCSAFLIFPRSIIFFIFVNNFWSKFI